MWPHNEQKNLQFWSNKKKKKIWHQRKMFEVDSLFLSSENITEALQNTMRKYKGYLLYFGNGEQKQILIIENCFIVFQNIPH